MTQEQKAKAYDEALERARKLKENPKAIFFEEKNVHVSDYIFPELKESEDEKIRKWIITQLQFKIGDNVTLDNMICKAIAWLEKQDESDETKAKMFLINKGYPIDTNGIFPTYEEMYNIIKEGFENQGKSAKVEPKFKVGDWCIDNEDGTIFQILKVLDNTYTYKTNEGKEYSCTHYSLENDARLWTIQDAKEGDVLALDWKDEQWLWQKIVIFKSLNEFSVEGYGSTFKNNKLAFNDDDVPYYSKAWTKNLHPATKEQRDLLFAKMEEAGYEWNAEKKELTKMSLSLRPQNTWKPSDEEMYKKVETAIDSYYAPFSRDAEEMSEWLKNLKNRVQLQSTWKPSDEQMIALRQSISGCSYDIEPLLELETKLKEF